MWLITALFRLDEIETTPCGTLLKVFSIGVGSYGWWHQASSSSIVDLYELFNLLCSSCYGSFASTLETQPSSRRFYHC